MDKKDLIGDAVKYTKDNGGTIAASLGGSIIGSTALGLIGLPLLGAIAGAITAPILIKKYL